MKSLTFALLVLVLIVPTTLAAFNCAFTSDQNQCTTILNSNLNQSEKEALLSGLLYNFSSYPNHDFIFNYNTQIKVDASIENLSILNSQFIKNVWVSLLSIMPSVIEGDTLYVPSHTFALSAYGYNVSVPENYLSAGYPAMSNGDCKTIYTLTENIPTFNLFVNNQLQGHQKLQPLALTQDSFITAEFTVRTTIQQDHSQWQAYCRSWDRFGNCVSYEYKCEYTSTNYLQDQVSLHNSVHAKYYDQSPHVMIRVLDFYFNTTQVQFTVSNVSNLRITFQNSSYAEQRYTYSIVFSKRPFYLITLEARPTNLKQAKNLIAGFNNTLYVKAITHCSLRGLNHFSTLTSACNLILTKEEKQRYAIIPFNHDLTTFLKMIILLVVLYLLYRIIKYSVQHSLFFS